MGPSDFPAGTVPQGEGLPERSGHVFFQVVSLLGAGLILGAYVANQRGWSGPMSPAYNLANLAGALLLAWVAIVDQRIGFILLEAVWAVVTVPPLLRSFAASGRPAC